jgi:membrane protein YqaA with SNARE-associated domain
VTKEGLLPDWLATAALALIQQIPGGVVGVLLGVYLGHRLTAGREKTRRRERRRETAALLLQGREATAPSPSMP